MSESGRKPTEVIVEQIEVDREKDFTGMLARLSNDLGTVRRLLGASDASTAVAIEGVKLPFPEGAAMKLESESDDHAVLTVTAQTGEVLQIFTLDAAALESGQGDGPAERAKPDLNGVEKVHALDSMLHMLVVQQERAARSRLGASS